MDNNRIKILKRLLFLETIFLIGLFYIINQLYFNYEKTKKIIDNFIFFSSRIVNQIFEIFKNVMVFLNYLYHGLTSEFSNRELAIGFWFLIFIIYLFFNKNIRKQLIDIAKIVLSKNFILWYITMVLYLLVVLFILKKVGLWEIKFLKETIIWFLAVGVISSGKAVGEARDLKYFINFIKNNIKLFIVFQFVINLYSFSFIWEVIIVFIITVTTIMVTILDTKPEYQDKNGKILKNFFNTILSIIGFLILYHSINMVIVNRNEIVFLELIKLLLLPSILSIMFILYIYVLVIYSTYEQLFIRIGFMKTIEDKYRVYLKLRILLFCNINIIRINKFLQRSKIFNNYVRSKDDVQKLIDNYKTYKYQSNLSE